MAIISIIFFCLTALGGIYLLSYILGNKNTPKGVALIHGSAAIIALLTLLVASFFNHTLIYLLIFFILTAAGGVVLFICDLIGKKIPKSLALGHGVMAILGLVVIILLLKH